MKIQKFNEKVSSEIEEFIDEFNGQVDNSILDWIATVSNDSKLKEYSNIDFDEDNIYTKSELDKKLKIADNKKFKYYKKYIERGVEIYNLFKQIQKLKNENKKLFAEINSEVLYKFQEELLEKDFDSFYKLVLVTDDAEETNIFIDTHPLILKKYKKQIEEKVELYRNSKKYNL